MVLLKFSTEYPPSLLKHTKLLLYDIQCKEKSYCLEFVMTEIIMEDTRIEIKWDAFSRDKTGKPASGQRIHKSRIGNSMKHKMLTAHSLTSRSTFVQAVRGASSVPRRVPV